MPECGVCFRHCIIEEGKSGFCGGRACREGRIVCVNYGKISSAALDPIEKKPLRRFHPGSMILSVGSYGCNLDCPFCQNHEISRPKRLKMPSGSVSPERLADMAEKYRSEGNIGLAFTYNEPLIGYEFVRDAARLVKERGMLCVLVTNGCAEPHVLEETAPYIDAMNIDIKGFTDRFYSGLLSGRLESVKTFIARAVQLCHVELTELVIPGENDSEEEMRELTGWIAGLKDADGRTAGDSIPLHVSRFFPRFRMTDRDATDVKRIYRLAEVAREKLRYVYTGNC
ncbi:MAG: AmmeMemoRadiSam system radical SAM enzyme [Oscillospiraceae bacterium]|nr:AmmeMemoRadiSam system radical SAM enzyme [Oscillospiraceae bacterium]